MRGGEEMHLAGTAEAVVTQLERFRNETGVDEIITVHPASTVGQRLRSIDLLADAASSAPSSR